jgi:hypothetical protein
MLKDGKRDGKMCWLGREKEDGREGGRIIIYRIATHLRHNIGLDCPPPTSLGLSLEQVAHQQASQCILT